METGPGPTSCIPTTSRGSSGSCDRDLDAGSAGTESEYRMITADGETRWVLDRAVFVPGEDGRPAEMIGLLIDVTGLHEALDAQAESERRLRTTIGNIPGMVYRSQAVAPWSDELIAGGDVSVTGYSVEELTRPGLPLGRHHGARGRAAAGRGHEGRGRRRSRRRRVPHPHQGRR